MTFRTVSHDDLERIAFEHPGTQIEAGDHCDHLIVNGAYYCARREDVA